MQKLLKIKRKTKKRKKRKSRERESPCPTWASAHPSQLAQQAGPLPPHRSLPPLPVPLLRVAIGARSTPTSSPASPGEDKGKATGFPRLPTPHAPSPSPETLARPQSPSRPLPRLCSRCPSAPVAVDRRSRGHRRPFFAQASPTAPLWSSASTTPLDRAPEPLASPHSSSSPARPPHRPRP